MSTEGELKVLFKRSDEHRDKITHLETAQGIMEKQFAAFTLENSAQHKELKDVVDGIAKSVKTLSNDYQQRLGKKDLTRWMLPVVVAIASVAVAMASALNSS